MNGSITETTDLAVASGESVADLSPKSTSPGIFIAAGNGLPLASRRYVRS